ncbi:MAG: flagellar hook-length control protein FliK, partial [Desulfobacterales bacterium]|nr:flagellar hook-length control protein FliK [Desulfobacterales bacterium]
RDLLESNLPQLKAELQQQGLDVEEFDVSLEDEKQHFRREERRARGNRQGGHTNGRPVEEDERAKDGRGQETRRASVDRTSGIDYFA